MSGESDIPADVKRAALAALEAAYHPAKSSTDQIIDAVCNAIIGERERCAVVAEEVGRAYGDDEAGWLDCSETIARAIRKATP